MTAITAISHSTKLLARRGAQQVGSTRQKAARGSIGFVSTYPPTKCGLATFTAALARALPSTTDTGIVRCVDEPQPRPLPDGVVAEWVRGSSDSLAAAAEVLGHFDSVVVQHEFGIFGGRDGDDILELVARLVDAGDRRPAHRAAVAVAAAARIIEELARTAHRVVAQSAVARARLLEAHDVDPAKVVVIQHGATREHRAPPPARGSSRRPVILTWGLLGPGKGIEFAIDAVAGLRDLQPAPRYVVLGETHPNIVRESGEAYRESLIARAVSRGIAGQVEFVDGYRDTTAVLAEVRKADLVLLPYLSRDQVVSGVLVEAIASAKPVVSTAFPHAVELLGEGSGIVVPHEDSAAMARALRTLLTDERRAANAARVARRQADALAWDQIGRDYQRLALPRRPEPATEVRPVLRPARVPRMLPEARRAAPRSRRTRRRRSGRRRRRSCRSSRPAAARRPGRR